MAERDGTDGVHSADPDVPTGDETAVDETAVDQTVVDETVVDEAVVAAPTPRNVPVVLAVDADDDPDAPRTAEQPWHPFEQPSWLTAAADPRLAAGPGGSRGGDGADFMGVSHWEFGQEAESIEDRRRPWLLGALAAAAVVVVLTAIAFFALRPGDTASPGPGVGTVTTVGDSSAAPTTDPVLTSAVDPVVVPTVDATQTPAPISQSSATGPTNPGTDPGAGPLGGSERDIACAPGFIVQVASGGDEASFVTRIAELRAAGQLPTDAAVARTATSCAIFAGQANSVVLYTGPYRDPYDGCEARLASAPDSFIKGTTAETATRYVSCLCPAQVVSVPTVNAIGQTGVWVGELQRILGNRLNIGIPDLKGNWGTFTDGTSAAVKTFQTDAGLPATGTVDAGTWQALQQAQC